MQCKCSAVNAIRALSQYSELRQGRLSHSDRANRKRRGLRDTGNKRRSTARCSPVAGWLTFRSLISVYSVTQGTGGEWLTGSTYLSMALLCVIGPIGRIAMIAPQAIYYAWHSTLVLLTVYGIHERMDA